MSKLKKHSVAKTKSKWKLPICDNFIETKTLQREFASATIATLVDLNKGIKMSTSKKLCQPVTVIRNGKTCNEKNRITDRHIKRHDSSKKKVKSINKPSQLPLTSYKGIVKPKKAPLPFKFVKTQILSGSQDQKERKTASNVTTFFSYKKKSPQRKFASATIAFLVDLTNETIMNTSR